MTENISIHALVKRATYPIEKIEIDRSNFNPRPREEGDGTSLSIYQEKTKFQSTPS